MNTFAGAIRSLTRIGRGPLGLLVMAVILGAATGAALAQDEGNAPAEPAQATSTEQTTDATTTTTDELATTTDVADETTVAEDSTSTEEDGKSSADTAASEELTTTTSDDLNSVQYSSTRVAEPKVADDSNTCTEWNAKLNGYDGELTFTDANSNPVTFTFTSSDGGLTSVWHASAPFFGEILVKSGSGDNSVTTVTVNGEQDGTVTSPNVNPQGQRQQISHICVRGTVETSTTTTTSTPNTGSTAGTTGGGGGSNPAGVQGATGGGGNAPATANQAGAAAEVSSSSGGLPFTGMHAPLLILMGLALAGAGFVLRRRLKDVS
jgi:hypothetical protein